MAVKLELSIEIDPDGTVEMTTRGFKGGECEDELKPIERALGKVTSRKRTREYYERTKAGTRLTTQAE